MKRDELLAALRRIGACVESRAWVNQFPADATFAQIYQDCDQCDWLEWLIRVTKQKNNVAHLEGTTSKQCCGHIRSQFPAAEIEDALM